MTSPVLLVVDDDAQAMAALEQALHRRYGADYRVVAEQFPVAAVESLERLRSQAGPVALVIAPMDATDHRGGPAGPDSSAPPLGWIDGWLLKPWQPAEEFLHLPVTEQLTYWIWATGPPGFVAWRIVGHQWTPRSHELRDLLDRNAVPYQFLPHDPEAGRQLLAEAGHLEHLTLGDTRTGRTQTVPGTALFILIGAQPHTD